MQNRFYLHRDHHGNFSLSYATPGESGRHKLTFTNGSLKFLQNEARKNIVTLQKILSDETFPPRLNTWKRKKNIMNFTKS